MPEQRCRSTGKLIHRTHDGAAVVARKMKNSQLNVYRCEDCKGWHVGRSRAPHRINERLDQVLGRKPFRIGRADA